MAAVEPALDAAADDELCVGGAVVGAVALVLFRAATELAIGDDGRVLPAAELDARLPDRVDAFGELLEQGLLRSRLALMGVKRTEAHAQRGNAW